MDVGNWATFNCSVSCKFSKTHTFKWFVGSSNSRRIDSVSDFYQRTGIQVELKELTRCESNPTQEMAHHQLFINVTSELVELLNKTAVQCAALRKASTFSDLYSHYGVILVNGKLQVHMYTCTVLPQCAAAQWCRGWGRMGLGLPLMSGMTIVSTFRFTPAIVCSHLRPQLLTCTLLVMPLHNHVHSWLIYDLSLVY